MALSSANVSNYVNTTSGIATNVVGGAGLSGAGAAVIYAGGPPVVGNVRVLEDGTTQRVLEDGATVRITEP